MNPLITVGDLSAALSRFHKDVPLHVVCGDLDVTALSLQATYQYTIPNQVTVTSVSLCVLTAATFVHEDSDDGDFDTNGTTVLGQVTPKPIPDWDDPTNRGDEFVMASITELPLLPQYANPFHYDASSMGTSLVRGWIIMHDGYDSKDNERALRSMTLVNRRSGQQFYVDLSRMDMETDYIRPQVEKLT
jgi:hypothetical protein